MCTLCRRLETTDDPFRIARLEWCDVILGDNQGCPGWCTLILRRHVEHLDELSVEVQAAVFAEVALVARGVRTCFPTEGEGGGPVRINYECLGNVAAHVHWHVVPRHATDPTLRAVVWGWEPEALRGSMTHEERLALAARLRVAMHA